MNKFFILSVVCYLVAFASVCQAQQYPISANDGSSDFKSPNQSGGNAVLNAIDDISPIPLDELIITPIVVPVGIVYGASLIAFSVAGSIIAAPIVLPSMIADTINESSSSQCQ